MSMKELSVFERFIYWLDEKLARYNCDKGRHRWVYTLSESGVVYIDETKVPDELWYCSECGIKRYASVLDDIK
jgi:hypothetical protein